MDLFAQDFESITFRDVVDFCDQRIVENTELDYKQELPRDLSKHFAAMSNRYGGLIIVRGGRRQLDRIARHVRGHRQRWQADRPGTPVREQRPPAADLRGANHG
jgi:hypothetical protein